MPKIGVNIDHVATVRQARRGLEPDPITAAKICEQAGADSIVAHLREDRRHINEKDIRALRKIVKTRLNLEMSLSKEIIQIASRIRPDIATIVPEKRQEITTEGGLDVIRHFRRVKTAADLLTKKGIIVSLFVDPEKKQIDKTKDAGITHIELHTGRYADAKTKTQKRKELKKLATMTRYAINNGIKVAAGHGLKYHDTRPIANIKGIDELNIGHSIISRSVFVGLSTAVKEMKKLAR